MSAKADCRHGKQGTCATCLSRRLKDWDARVEAMFRPRMPSALDQCIPVRGHFRRSKKYLKRDPKFRELVLRRLRGLVAESEKES